VDVLAGADATVVDPFSGSGVVPIEAWLRGCRSVAGDIVDVAIRLSQAKVTLLHRHDLETEHICRAITDAVQRARQLKFEGMDLDAVCAEYGIRQEAKRYFSPAVLVEIAFAKEACLQLAPDACQIAAAVLSALLHEVSAMREVHHSYIVDRSLPKVPATTHVDVERTFRTRIWRAKSAADLARQDIELSRAKVQTHRPVIDKADAVQFLRRHTGAADLVLTSPPYFGMQDYTRAHYLSELVFPTESFDADINAEIGARRRRRSLADAEAYLKYMSAWFVAAREALASDGTAVLVIGESKSAIARQVAPLRSLEVIAMSSGLRFVWRGQRRVLFRKVHHRVDASEQIWVLRAE